MVYKKYIQKNGKVYGPYIYHSRRVNGKVISEYHGMKKDIKFNSFVFVALGIFIFVFMAYAFFNLKSSGGSGITGNVVLNTNSEENASVISMSLREGELIPSSSKIIFESSDNNYEYALNSIVSEETIFGNYYVEDNSLSEEGEGYGFNGEKLLYPKIYFTLISSQKQPEEETPTEEPEETPAEKPEEIPEEQEPANDTLSEEQSSEENPSAEEPAETPVETALPTEETPTEEPEETPAEEPVTNEEQEQIPEEQPSEENPSAEEPEETPAEEPVTNEEQEQIPEEQPSEENPSAEEPEETPAEEPAETSSTITGGVISRIFSTVSNFFLGILRSTGMTVSSSAENEINGEVNANEPFVYAVKKEESIKLVSGSVKTDSKSLDDSAITMSFDGDKIIIETNYSESERGFGEAYLGDDIKTISINIPEEINLSGIQKIRITYNGEELALKDKIPEINETEIIKNTTINVSINFNASLTEEERSILKENFGNLSVLPAKSELFNGRYVIGYSLGDYKIEYSYDSDINEDELIPQIENDRIKWLKDIAERLSQEEEIHEKVNISISDIPQ